MPDATGRDRRAQTPEGPTDRYPAGERPRERSSDGTVFADRGASRPPFGALQVAIVVVGVLIGANRLFVGLSTLFAGEAITGLQAVYVLHGLGVLALLVLLYAPLPFLPTGRSGIRALFIAWTIVLLSTALVLGNFDLYNTVSAVLEAVLVVLLLVEARRVAPPAEPAGSRPSRHR